MARVLGAAVHCFQVPGSGGRRDARQGPAVLEKDRAVVPNDITGVGEAVRDTHAVSLNGITVGVGQKNLGIGSDGAGRRGGLRE